MHQDKATSVQAKSELSTLRSSEPAEWSWLTTPLCISGLILVASGFVHFGIWSVSGTSWSGEVSWRKPTLFGISGGITLVSMAALLPKLALRRRDPYMAIILSISMLFEVGLISLQQWRGVASHFNESTAFDARVDLAITLLICVVTMALLDFGIRCFGPMSGTSDTKLAWRGGIAFLLISCAIGFVILVYGHLRSAEGQDPTVYGTAGVVKFPHGMAIHTIQSLPCIVWFLAALRVPEADRFRVVRSLIISMIFLMGYSVLQTLAGRDRGDVTPLSLGLLIFAVLSLAPAAPAVYRRW